MENNNYVIAIPNGLLSICNFNKCQSDILELKEKSKVLLSDEEQLKMDKAYEILEEVQNSLFENLLERSELYGEDNYVLGKVALYKNKDSLDFPSDLLEL